MTPVAERYRALLAAGELQPDADQARAVAVLDALAAELAALPQKGSIVWRIIGHRAKPPGGCYLWGGVGRGKSMLMDLAFETIDHAPEAPRPLPRIHARGPRAPARRAREARRATRSRRSRRRSPPRRGCSASTRW